jgi:hypothetical protein
MPNPEQQMEELAKARGEKEDLEREIVAILKELLKRDVILLILPERRDGVSAIEAWSSVPNELLEFVILGLGLKIFEKIKREEEEK